VKGVRDALRRLDGVASLTVDLQTNLVTITPDPRVELDLAAVPAAVRRAGFTPADLRLVARGTLTRATTGDRFRIRGWSRELPLRASSALPEGEQSLSARVDVSGPEPVLEPTAPR
jgi:copper chaperone CopZ